MSEQDKKIAEIAREYQKAERAAIKGGSIENEYAWRRKLYELLDTKYGPIEKEAKR